MNINTQLVEFFAERGFISEAEFAQIFDECEKSQKLVYEYLIENKQFPETQLMEALAEYCCLPYIDAEMLRIDSALLKSMNLTYLKRLKVMPVCIDASGTLIVAIARPFSIAARSATASIHTGKREYILVAPSKLERCIDAVLTVQSTAKALDSIGNEQQFNDSSNADAEKAQIDIDIVNAPAVRLVDSIIREAIPIRASDIHIEPFENEVSVRYRIDGDLNERASFQIESYKAVCARLKIMSNINIAERRVPQDGRFSMSINDVEYDFRVSTLPSVYGEKFVIRVLDKNAFSYTRNELGFTEESNNTINEMLAHPHGIILLTGPTGCGKSTTLYTFLRELNSSKVNIVTVEDPVEHTIKGINQVQVNSKANLTFATTLRSILRQDPNIIMVGEIRDSETVQIAIRAAITGHLVFSTLHTNDAVSAIARLEDMGVSSYLIADAVVGVISQRLIKCLCPMCKKEALTSESEMAMLGIDKPAKIYRPHGCAYCNGTGYKGRTAATEILRLDDDMRHMINSRTSTTELREYALNHGMISLLETCKSYVLNGTTSIQEMLSLTLE